MTAQIQPDRNEPEANPFNLLAQLRRKQLEFALLGNYEQSAVFAEEARRLRLGLGPDAEHRMVS